MEEMGDDKGTTGQTDKENNSSFPPSQELSASSSSGQLKVECEVRTNLHKSKCQGLTIVRSWHFKHFQCFNFGVFILADPI
jgi:hypothetical protein